MVKKTTKEQKPKKRVFTKKPQTEQQRVYMEGRY